MPALFDFTQPGPGRRCPRMKDPKGHHGMGAVRAEHRVRVQGIGCALATGHRVLAPASVPHLPLPMACTPRGAKRDAGGETKSGMRMQTTCARASGFHPEGTTHTPLQLQHEECRSRGGPGLMGSAARGLPRCLRCTALASQRGLPLRGPQLLPLPAPPAQSCHHACPNAKTISSTKQARPGPQGHTTRRFCFRFTAGLPQLFCVTWEQRG